MFKGKSVFFVSALFVSLLLMGCKSTGRINLGPDLPREETTRITFSEVLVVQEINDIRVYNEFYPRERSRENVVTLPAGEITMLFNLRAYVRRGQNLVVRVFDDDLVVIYNFEPGKRYSIGLYVESLGAAGFFLGHFKYSIGIWENANMRGRPARTWELGEWRG